MKSIAIEPRECHRDIETYAPASGSCAIDLSDNTNLWGAPPAAMRILRARGAETISRYPQSYSADLRENIADYAGVGPEMIVAGCGSDDVIDSAIRAFGDAGDVLALADPTFSMLPVFAKMNGLRTASFAFDEEYEPSADAIIGSGARIIYLCSPNNPTGTTLSRAFVEKIVRGTAALVIIDQAYIEFGGQAFADIVSTGRVLLTRTMSKAIGLAGLRIGYGIGAPDLIRAVEKARGPYKVNSVAEAVGSAVLREDRGWIAERIADVRTNRARFVSELTALGYAPIPSEANFVLVPVADSANSAAILRREGIAVRAMPSLTGIGDALRVSIGPWPMMERCVVALRAAR